MEEWRALYELEPWDAERTDLAVGTAIMHNAVAHGKMPKEPIEYMPFLRRKDVKPQSEKEMKATWSVVCATMARLEDERSAADDRQPKAD